MVRRLIRAVLVCMILLKTVLDATDMQSSATTATENRELATIDCDQNILGYHSWYQAVHVPIQQAF